MKVKRLYAAIDAALDEVQVLYARKVNKEDDDDILEHVAHLLDLSQRLIDRDRYMRERNT